jgi:hypothetical protein
MYDAAAKIAKRPVHSDVNYNKTKNLEGSTMIAPGWKRSLPVKPGGRLGGEASQAEGA